MKKILIFVVIAFAMLLCSCGAGAGENASPDVIQSKAPGSSASTTPVSDEPETPSPSETPDVSASPVSDEPLPYSPKDYNLTVLDIDGNDITARVIELWYNVNSMYNEDLAGPFELGEYNSTMHPFTLDDGTVQGAGFEEILNFDEAVSECFTDEGAEQFTAAVTENHFIEEYDGKIWRKCPWRTGWTPALNIPSAKTADTEKDTIRLQIEVQTPPDFSSSYVDFTLKCVDGVWLVDSYVYPWNIDPTGGRGWSS